MTKGSSNSAFNLKGRGILGGLVSSEAPTTQPAPTGAAEWISIDQIKPGAFQPRQYFSEESIESLANSFKEQGFRGAINVRPLEDNTYEIVAGERRWRAAKKAGLPKVRCIVDRYSDEEALEFALVENLQREDLSKLEETEGILQLIETKLGIAQADAISIIRTEGHSDKQARSDVAPSEQLQEIEQILSFFNVELQTFRTKNLRTLTLPDDLKEAHLRAGLPYSSALELSKIKDEKARRSLLKEAQKKQLSFRDIKQRVQEANSKLGNSEVKQETDPEEKSLIERLELTVKRVKKSKTVLEKTQKRKRLERLLHELETLLDDNDA